MSLSSALPVPLYSSSAHDEFDVERAFEEMTSFVEKAGQTRAPRYGNRVGWVPRCDDDFDDGGAFPEVPCVQFPYGMGKSKKEVQSNALPVHLGTDGKVRYEMLLRQEPGTSEKIIHHKYEDLIPAVLKDGGDTSLEKPSEEETRELTEKTRMALEKEVNAKIAAAMPSKAAVKLAAAQYIRYTPSQQSEEFNSGAKQRVIRMVEKQRDPMSPPRFKINNKIPAAPPSPPAPVMHSPPRKVSVKDQQEWKIPPCISNWKNPKGYTIPLDKRLASDGRGLQDPHINDNFAKLAEALYIADRKAREAVEMRSQLEKKVIQKEKELKEENLQKLAQKAREERSSIKMRGTATEEEAEREKLRYERHKERERQRRIAKAGAEKRTAFEREKERDISEKIALGMPSVKPSQDSLFDQRLFNQTRGLDSGFAGGDDDIYNVFDQPWNNRANLASNIYKPTKNVDTEMYGNDIENIIKTYRFNPDKGFSGAEPDTQSRSGPVQFEKKPVVEEDPFQLDKFLSEAKKGKRASDTQSHSGHTPKRDKK